MTDKKIKKKSAPVTLSLDRRIIDKIDRLRHEQNRSRSNMVAVILEKQLGTNL